MLATMHPDLLAVKETTTPEELRGILGHVFDALPEDARSVAYHEQLVSEGYNNLSALTLLDVSTLRALGIKMAHVQLILAAVSGPLPATAPPPPSPTA